VYSIRYSERECGGEALTRYFFVGAIVEGEREKNPKMNE